MRLLILAPFPRHIVPGQRFRFEQYLDTWADAGIDVEVHSLLTEGELAVLYRPGHQAAKVAMMARGALRRLRDLSVARRFDVAWVYRDAFPLGYPIFERAVAALGVPYVHDFDDAIWLPNSTEANRLVAPLKFAGKTAIVARHAACVTVGNEYLATWARQHQADVRVLPTTIDTDRYQPVEGRVADGPLCVGWSGSTTTIPHLRTVEDVLRRLQQERGIAIRVISDVDYVLPGATVESIRWQEETEPQDLAPIDIGIMPLPDDEWSRGKCGAKALQYMARAIPTVMSPVGVNADIAAGGAALTASTHDEWHAAITRLLDDADLRRTLGAAGRRRVEDRFSVQAIAPAYVSVVRDVAGRRASA
jgi:glycosyltransferase involved in cell wall biosynthesis